MTFSIKQEPNYAGYEDAGESGEQQPYPPEDGFHNGNGEEPAEEYVAE